MTVQCKKVTVWDGVELTEEEFKAFEIVEECLRQLSNTLGRIFENDTICDLDGYGLEFQVSDIYDVVKMIKDNVFTIPSE